MVGWRKFDIYLSYSNFKYNFQDLHTMYELLTYNIYLFKKILTECLLKLKPLQFRVSLTQMKLSLFLNS